jgi:hypothetical protein
MNETDVYSIAVEDQDIVIRLNSDLVDRDALTKLLDYIELESIRKRSRLTEAQASRLASEVDRNVWERTRHNYMEE